MDTEEEQVEKLKAWLKENGLSIVFGIVIGIGGIGGYNYWVSWQNTVAEEASGHFSLMMESMTTEDAEQLQLHADALITEFADTEYAQLAHLALARHQVGKADYAAAVAELQQVIGSAAQQPLAYVARTRLAQVQIQLEQYEQALKTLAVDFPDDFAALAEELRGDVLAGQGKKDEAIAAYRKAQLASPEPANPEFLRQKLNDLGSRS